MKISVIIPVYNADRYLQRAVVSALEQPEAAEVLLIEDNSSDNSLRICQALESKHSRVRLLRHSDGGNHGAGATRNLGIRSARCNYIAFLDADDYYLPERFTVPRRLFLEHKNIHGVYEAIGVHFYDERSRLKWMQLEGEYLSTITEKIAPTRLFEYLLKSRNQYLHLDGLLVKSNVFDTCGYLISEGSN